MKFSTSKSSLILVGFKPVLLGLLCCLAVNKAKAANQYFDVNGSTSGYGVANNGSYSWDGVNWGVSGGTGATTAWTPGTFARFYGAASYTVTVNASESMAGLFQNGGTSQTLTISDAGGSTGNLSIVGGGTTTPNDPTMNVQGFLCIGNVIINCPIIGPGGIQHSQSKDLRLNATNSYAGGTWTTGGQLIYYNNSYAFGSGHIYVGGSGDAIINSSTSALTITNNFVFPTAGYNFNLAGGNPVGGAPGTTFSGTFSLPSGTTMFFTSSGASQVDKISGVISGVGAALLIADNGTMILAATNTYTGLTTVGNGSLTAVTPTLEISGAIAGDLAVTNTAKLTLDHAATLKSSAKFYFASTLAAGAINLNFTGSNTVLAVYLDGVLQPAGTWGAIGSGAANQNATFTGTGFLYVPAAPVIVQQPKSLATYPQTPSRTFAVLVTGDQPSMTYQWKLNNNNLTDDGITISGSQTAQLTLFPPYTVGTYTCAITNVAGFTNTQPATLTFLATNDYVNAILASTPLAYWRLDETTGTAANDWVGLHQGVYINANLNQPGFSAAPGSDPAMGIPANAAQKGYMVISNASPDFSFPTASATPTFTFEAWGKSTNFSANVKQRLISTLTLTGAGGYGFGLPDNQHLQLTAGGVDEFDAIISPPLAAGVWYHFAATCDGNNFVLYVNGSPVGSTNNSLGFNLPASPGQFTVGNNPLAYPTEQFYGAIDEVAIYNVALDPTTISNHFLARYTDLAAPTATTPVVTPPTNYVSLSATLTEAAGGAGLAYQWYRGAGTASPIGGATSSTLTLSPLQLSDAASYHCVITDAASHTADSPLASLAVLPIPTSAAALNLTNALVLHLPFDSDYKDISGRVNDGTAVGSPALVGSAAIGTGALHYGTTNGVATNYVTVGVRPDLQFGASTDFSVACWVRGTLNTNLPFFCDVTGGEAGITNGGYYFGPNTTGNGGWAVGVASPNHQMTSSGGGIINDGNWHHLVHAVKRTGNVTTYLDGAEVDSHAVSFVTDSIDTGNPANIGQDGTGGQVFTQDQEGDIDDLAVWTRTLTSLEVSGIYLAGASNNVSFAPPVANPIVRVALQIQQVAPGQYQIVWLGPGTLTASGDVLGTYTNVPSASSPYTIPTSSGPQLFYRLKY
jgi:autotransporter-associated beta strand protein